jgi:hypothetical protein
MTSLTTTRQITPGVMAKIQKPIRITISTLIILHLKKGVHQSFLIVTVQEES